MTVEQVIKKLQKLNPKAKCTAGDMAGMSFGNIASVSEDGDGSFVHFEYRETSYNGEKQ